MINNVSAVVLKPEGHLRMLTNEFGSAEREGKTEEGKGLELNRQQEM